jgi:hypothetical protein
MWTPDNSLLAQTDELTNIFYNIIHVAPSGERSIVTISKNQQDSLEVSGDIISGYYTDCFEDTNIKFLAKDKTYVDVQKFKEVDLSKLYEVISYEADLTEEKQFSYTAVARDSLGNVLDTKEYTITVTNNWTTGKIALQELVRLSKVPSDNLVRWSNGVIFVNILNQPVIWESSL